MAHQSLVLSRNRLPEAQVIRIGQVTAAALNVVGSRSMGIALQAAAWALREPLTLSLALLLPLGSYDFGPHLFTFRKTLGLCL